MANLDFCYYTIAEANRSIESGYLSPVALTEALFDQIEETDGRLNSYVRLMRESALEEAEASQLRTERGERLGPLDGIGIGVKDLYDTAGVVTAGGTGAYRERGDGARKGREDGEDPPRVGDRATEGLVEEDVVAAGAWIERPQFRDHHGPGDGDQRTEHPQAEVCTHVGRGPGDLGGREEDACADDVAHHQRSTRAQTQSSRLCGGLAHCLGMPRVLRRSVSAVRVVRLVVRTCIV